MISARRTRTFLALALGCVVSVVFAPLFPEIHQTYARHRHTICLDHHRVEDDGPRLAQAAVPGPAPNRGVERSERTGSLDLRPPCPLSGFSVNWLCTAGDHGGTTGLTSPPSLLVFASPTPHTTPLFRLAPKQSPPTLHG